MPRIGRRKTDGSESGPRRSVPVAVRLRLIDPVLQATDGDVRFLGHCDDIGVGQLLDGVDAGLADLVSVGRTDAVEYLEVRTGEFAAVAAGLVVRAGLVTGDVLSERGVGVVLVGCSFVLGDVLASLRARARRALLFGVLDDL